MDINKIQSLKLFFLFLIINIVVYTITEIASKDKIDTILNNNSKILNAHYEVLLETQYKIATGLYKSTLTIDKVLKIMKEANLASEDRKQELRAELHKLLQVRFNISKEKGVIQYHFILPNNVSFYRAHKPNKFGDDLTDIRADITYVNKTKKAIRGFTRGKTTHAFRNAFPLYDSNGTYVGAVDVSFSSENFQWYLNTVSHIHSHFLVSKKLFDVNIWESDDILSKYTQSSESKEYMLSLGDIHSEKICVIENKLKLDPIRDDIDTKMSQEKAFSIYVNHEGHIDIMSFLPIQNIDKRVVAWIVSFEESTLVYAALKNGFIMKIVSFLTSLLIIYFLLKQIQAKEELEKQHKLLNYILNETDNLMFITDFKNIKYANDKFKSLLNIKNIDIFNEQQHHNLLNIFENKEGYLHTGLLNDDEDFITLIARTLSRDRIVSILDKNFETTTFKISISKTENEDFLVTLSDITQIKEYQIQTEVKAYMDGLTNVYNRNKFDEIMDNEFKYVKRYNYPLTIALLDIDDFKKFNDTYGHLIGDEVLISMAQTVNSNVRETDTFARWGGEEFVILFKNTDIKHAQIISQKLRKEIQANKHKTAGTITVSFGITEYKKGDTIQSIFKRCDDALYIAKENGKNRVEVL